MSTQNNNIKQEDLSEEYLDFGASSEKPQGLPNSEQETNYQVYIIKEEDWKRTCQDSNLLSNMIGSVQSSTDKDVGFNPTDLPETLQEQILTSLDQSSEIGRHIEASDDSRGCARLIFKKEATSHDKRVSQNISCTTTEDRCGNLINTTPRSGIKLTTHLETSTTNTAHVKNVGDPQTASSELPCPMHMTDQYSKEDSRQHTSVDQSSERHEHVEASETSQGIVGRIFKKEASSHDKGVSLNISCTTTEDRCGNLINTSSRNGIKLTTHLETSTTDTAHFSNGGDPQTASSELSCPMLKTDKSFKEDLRQQTSLDQSSLRSEDVEASEGSQDNIGDIYRKENSFYHEAVSQNECTSCEGSCDCVINTTYSYRDRVDPELNLETVSMNRRDDRTDEDRQTASSELSCPMQMTDQHSKEDPRFVAIHQLATHIRNCQGILPYECIVCNKKFDARRQCVQHMLTHKPKKLHKCSECNMTFHLKSGLVKHVESHQIVKPKCSLCNKSFASKKSLVRHMKRKKRQCSECSMAFHLKSDLVKHLESHQIEKPQCSLCNKNFASKVSLVRHMKLHSRKGLHHCSRCNKGYTSKSELARHMRTHAGKTAYKCSFCVKEFKTIKALMRHMKSHTDKVLHSCPNCNETYRSRYKLNEHIRIRHNGEKSFQCSQCQKRFENRYLLSRHIRTHTGEKPYQCDMCGKTFSQLGSVERHMKVHTGEKPHQCSECKKSFVEKSKLTRHMKIHTGKTGKGEKPYQCSECNKLLSSKQILASHMRLHTGEKPFMCSYCEEAFISKDALVRHVQIHTGAKPFSCSWCNDRFVCKQDLTQHFKKHTKPYKCSKCATGFRARYALVNHMKTHI